jgi:hypothetical protein
MLINSRNIHYNLAVRLIFYKPRLINSPNKKKQTIVVCFFFSLTLIGFGTYENKFKVLYYWLI